MFLFFPITDDHVSWECRNFQNLPVHSQHHDLMLGYLQGDHNVLHLPPFKRQRNRDPPSEIRKTVRNGPRQ